MDFESASEELSKLDDTALGTVARLAELQLALEQAIETKEEELKALKKQLQEVSTEQLPAAMAEHGVSEFTLADGSKVSVKKFYGASISKARQDEAFHWLNENGYGDLIKNQVAASFVRGQEEEAREFSHELERRGMSVTSKKWVEPMTLKAWAKEMVEKGRPPPDDLFGLYVGDVTKISVPKKRND